MYANEDIMNIIEVNRSIIADIKCQVISYQAIISNHKIIIL